VLVSRMGEAYRMNFIHLNCSQQWALHHLGPTSVPRAPMRPATDLDAVPNSELRSAGQRSPALQRSALAMARSAAETG
jgi:GrpB-like predicted nucleotidyltransferase (UPF0157 family)